MFNIALMVLLAKTVMALSGSAVAGFCHCDLTTSFCDVNCCCDTDCSTAVSSNCYNLKSNSYCPDPTFFSRLGSTYLNSQGCFYFNSTNTILEEISIASRQTSQIINQQMSISRVSSSQAPVWAGYQQGDILSISGNTNLYLVNSNGDCTMSASTSIPAFNLRYGLNMKIQCQCTSCTTFPQLFTVFNGTKLNQFSGDTSRTITLPSFTDTSITDVQINIILGTYGSSKIKNIERVTSSTSSSGGSTRSITFTFVQSSSIMQTSSSPTFFPQIPQDMFYPIYLLS